MAGLLGRLAAAREEVGAHFRPIGVFLLVFFLQVADLRGQHGELTAEADNTREKLSRQLQEKQEEIQQVQYPHLC